MFRGRRAKSDYAIFGQVTVFLSKDRGAGAPHRMANQIADRNPVVVQLCNTITNTLCLCVLRGWEERGGEGRALVSYVFEKLQGVRGLFGVQEEGGVPRRSSTIQVYTLAVYLLDAIQVVVEALMHLQSVTDVLHAAIGVVNPVTNV